MKALALALAFLLAAPDGGTDVPFADPDAGVYQVASAETPDGWQLGRGWWLAPGRMQKVGEHIVLLQNENDRLKFEASQSTKITWGFWVGMGLGFAVGTAGTVLLVNQVRK